MPYLRTFEALAEILPSSPVHEPFTQIGHASLLLAETVSLPVLKESGEEAGSDEGRRASQQDKQPRRTEDESPQRKWGKAAGK